MMKTEEFIEKAKNIHQNKYDYSKVQYVNSHTKVCIICPNHGEFWQTPNNHLCGKGCPKCTGHNKTTDEWIKEAYLVHQGKYDYTKVKYTNAKTKVCIICPIHGEFWQTPSDHLSGKGCPKCKSEKINKINSQDTTYFIEKAKLVHGDKYDYSKVNYTRSSAKVCIKCPTHGEFWQIANNHLRGYGCPQCAKQLRVNKKTLSNDEFIKRSIEVHGNKYDYCETKYHGIKKPVNIICAKHGVFSQVADNHLQGCGCPQCGQVLSSAEEDIVELLKPLKCQQRNRLILKGKEIDIYIRELGLGIEYNGLLWHSDKYGKKQDYHLNKLNECNKQGIKLIQIFEDEWVNHCEICKSKLRQICRINTNPKVYGRQCTIQEITDKKDVYDFLDKNHIQGRTGFTVGLGCYYNTKMVGVMTFKLCKDKEWDLNRFATDINYQCVGVGGKLFKYFIRNYDFMRIKSFADRRWTTSVNDNFYTKIGFKFDSFIKPTYTYYNEKEKYKRYHKFNFRKQILSKKYGFPLSMTEEEMTKKLGYVRIWDCGLIKYTYKNTINHLEK